MLDRTTAPQFKNIEDIHFIKASKHQLANDIPVFIINAGEQELVRIEFIFKNVNWDIQKPLLSLAANTMLNDGTSNLSGAEIANKIDYYGAFFQTEYGLDRSAVVLYSLNKHLPNTLPIIKEVLTDSVYPEKEVDTFINNQKQKLKVSLEKNDFLARRQFSKAIFGDTIYGFSSNLEDYDALNQADLRQHFQQTYHPENCTIVVSGKVNEDILTLLNSLFGAWKSDVVFKPNTVEFKAADEKYHYIEKVQALQSAIRIGMPSINRKHKDFPALQVLNTVLGGYFGSRLMANIREDKGYTYGIGSANVSLEQAGYFFIASEVGTDVCADTLVQIEKEVNILKTQLIGDEELALVKNYLLGSLLGSLENAFSHADKFKNIYFFNQDYEYYTNYINTIKTINAPQLLELANKYWDFDQFYKVIVGKV
jgi:predicted Zn-dependent peptidase